MGFFDKIKQGLTKTRAALSEAMDDVFAANEIDEDFYVEFGTEDTKVRAGVKYRVKLPAEKNKNDCLVPYIDKEVVFGIRPEHVHDEEEYLAKFPDGIINAHVEVTELMGAEIHLYINSEDQNMTARVSSRSKAKTGDTIKIALDVSRMHIFDKDTEVCICH